MTDKDLFTAHFWRLMNDGLANSTVTEFQDEMECLAIQADLSGLHKLAALARRNIHRYDGSYRVARAAL